MDLRRQKKVENPRINSEQNNEEDLKLESKISLIREKLKIKYSEEEKASFDEWLARIPENSAENPIIIEGVEEVLSFLPSAPDYRMEGGKNNLFLVKRNLLKVNCNQF